jgi:hypothetical protein
LELTDSAVDDGLSPIAIQVLELKLLDVVDQRLGTIPQPLVTCNPLVGAVIRVDEMFIGVVVGVGRPVAVEIGSDL